MAKNKLDSHSKWIVARALARVAMGISPDMDSKTKIAIDLTIQEVALELGVDVGDIEVSIQEQGLF